MLVFNFVFEMIKFMKVNSGIVVKVYFIILLLIVIFNRFIVRLKLFCISRMDIKDISFSVIGM